MNLFGKKQRPGWLCLNLHSDRIDLSHVLLEGKTRPEVLLCESFRKEGNDVDTLKRLRGELDLDRYQCLTLLKARDYQLLPVDAPKLQQVLLNLAGNAIEHSVPGARVWLSSRWETDQLIFAVRDEGPGLGQAEQARLFTPFGRGEARKTAGERSTGLRLAIARLVVEAHGGRIWVESQPGKGATFLFSLPLPKRI